MKSLMHLKQKINTQLNKNHIKLNASQTFYLAEKKNAEIHSYSF